MFIHLCCQLSCLTWNCLQVGSMSKQHGLTQCTTFIIDNANSQHSMFITLGAQIFVAMTKTNNPLVTLSSKEQEEVPKVHLKPLKISHDLECTFECLHDVPTIDTNGPRMPNGVLVRFFTLALWVPMIIQISLWCYGKTTIQKFVGNNALL